MNREVNTIKFLEKKFRGLLLMTFVLAALRVFNFDFWNIIGDLMTALVIYFFIRGPNKCMALITLLNGGISLINGLMRFFPAFSTLTNEFTLYSFILFSITLYGLIIYSMLCYYSYYAYNNLNDNTFESQNDVETNYASIPQYKPFSGKGTVLG